MDAVRRSLPHVPLSAIDVVEASYELESDDTTWLTRIAQTASPSLDRGGGVIAYLVEMTTMRMTAFGSTRPLEHRPVLQFLKSASPPPITEEFRSRPRRYESFSEVFAGVDAALRHWQANMAEFGVVDSLGVVAHASAGLSVMLMAPSAHLEQTHPRTRRVWERVAVHLAAGQRLRSGLQRTQAVPAAAAILDSSGRVHDAREEATSRAIREELREAVRAIEHARGPSCRDDPERALDLWRGLVAGRWSLVDHWDSDGKRFMLALENAPESLDPRALRPREGAALRLALEGAAPKDIAYALGISASNARALLSGGLRKLGLRSRADLCRWDLSRGAVHRLDSTISALAIPSVGPSQGALDKLTEAERDVALLAARGQSNTEIANGRRTSERTVANQLASILRKLGIGSRAEIATT
jgi:DNA-binding CsgD family transcriptional regulator